MRRILTMLVFLVVVFPLSALEVSDNDYLVARAAVTDCALAVTAGYIADPQYFMPGCTLGQETIPRTLMVVQSDLSGYLPMIPAKIGNQTWYQRLASQTKGPLDDQCRTILSVHDWREGDILLSGTYRADWPKGSSVVTLVAQALARHFDEVTVWVDLLLEGRRISRPIRVSGTARIASEGIVTDGLEFRYE